MGVAPKRLGMGTDSVVLTMAALVAGGPMSARWQWVLAVDVCGRSSTAKLSKKAYATTQERASEFGG